jgi:hypothetical protein
VAIKVNAYTGEATRLKHNEEIYLTARRFKRRSSELRNESLCKYGSGAGEAVGIALKMWRSNR